MPDRTKGHADNALFSLIKALAVIVGLLHLWAAFFPSASNWGFHHLAFLPFPIRVVVPFLMLLLVFPQVNKRFSAVIGYGAEYIGKMSKAQKNILFGIFLTSTSVLFWIFRERLYLLGDGYLLVGTIPHIHGAGDPYFFRNEPVANYAVWKAWQLLEYFKVSGADELAPQILSIAAGAASLVIIMRLVSLYTQDWHDRTLAFLFISVSGSSQLFFGYVENYTILYFGMLLFIWLALSCISGKIHPLAPSAAFGLLFMLHFGMICLMPAFLLLLYHIKGKSGLKMALGSLANFRCKIVL